MDINNDTHVASIVSGTVLTGITIGMFILVAHHAASFAEIQTPLSLIIGYVVRDIQHHNAKITKDGKSNGS